MNLSAPKTTTFYVALALGVLGFLGYFVQIPLVTENAFWFEFLGFLALAVGVYVKDL